MNGCHLGLWRVCPSQPFVCVFCQPPHHGAMRSSPHCHCDVTLTLSKFGIDELQTLEQLRWKMACGPQCCTMRWWLWFVLICSCTHALACVCLYEPFHSAPPTSHLAPLCSLCFLCLSVCSPPPALPPKKRQSAPSPTRVAVVAPMSRGSSLPCSVHRQVKDQGSLRKTFCMCGKTNVFFLLLCFCSSRTTSRSFCRGVSQAAASLTAATRHAFHLAAAWGSSASLTSNCPPWSRTAASVHGTPAVRRLVRASHSHTRLRPSILLPLRSTCIFSTKKLFIVAPKTSWTWCFELQCSFDCAGVALTYMHTVQSYKIISAIHKYQYHCFNQECFL